MNALEVAAGNIAAGVLGGQAVPRDVEGAPDATHDFDVVLPDGRRVALEVTSAADREVLSLLAAASRERTTADLRNDWQIGVEQMVGGSAVKISRLMNEIVGVLEVFERNGLTEVETRHSPQYTKAAPGTPQEVIEATMRQFELGAIVTRAWGPRKSPEAAHLYVTVHGGFGADIDKVNALVVTETEANRAKLVAAKADERHVFIWLNPSHPDAELAVHTGPPPATPPAIPAGIDVVWLATQGGAEGFGEAHVERLWRVRPPRDWEVLDPSLLS